MQEHSHLFQDFRCTVIAEQLTYHPNNQLTSEEFL